MARKIEKTIDSVVLVKSETAPKATSEQVIALAITLLKQTREDMQKVQATPDVAALEAEYGPGWIIGFSSKLAIAISALSANMALAPNCKLADIIRDFVIGSFPIDANDKKGFRPVTERFETVTAVACRRNYLMAIARAENLPDADLDAIVATTPADDYASQVLLRDKLHALMTGHGMSYKTLSMVWLVAWPLISWLVPVDRHVMARFGLDKDKNDLSDRVTYLAIERLVIRELEAVQADEEQCALIAEQGIDAASIRYLEWHWATWLAYRMLAGVPESTGVSHQQLGCRHYR
jgi:hypothetical protein